jgi:phenylalanyl-tRNA synthetase beta chain
MKVPIKWLQDYTDVTLTPVELANKLTSAGLEVVDIINTGGNWANVMVGQITAIDPHPNADRLRLATVNLGAEKETVVCGAPNLNIGDKIAFARVGAQLTNPYNGQVEKLKPAKIRGVLSSGMICSEQELGISDNHEGILVLPPEAPMGTPLADYMGDTVLDLDVTANRPDCLSVVGIAREAAAMTSQKTHIPEISYDEPGDPIDGQISIEIEAADLCSRYCASLITDIKIDDSPPWLQERLIACGMRPINNIVDISNYIMLEYGQPLHTFDYDRLKGKKIVVRRAQESEVLISLDNQDRLLSPDMLVIADGERGVALAGIMGGLNSEVTSGTTSILLESASFNAASIHYTSRHLSLVSEASMRFERGLSAGVTIPALKHATQLIMELGGGKVAKGIIDVYPGKRQFEPIPVSAAEVKRILGIEISLDKIAEALTLLGFDCQIKESEVLASVPYWRSDISYPVDIIEEVARVIGYDQIPTTLLSGQIPHQVPKPALNLKKIIKQSLVGCGFQEIATFTLVSGESLSKLTPEGNLDKQKTLKLLNPMTSEMDYLRPNLRANLLNTLVTNRRHEEGGIKLFELGKVYLPRENDLPDEPDVLCGLISGERVEKTWLGGNGLFDFYDAKGLVEALLGKLGITVSFEPGTDASLHPARQANIIAVNKNQKINLGVMGEVHPKVLSAFEITDPVCIFEISITALLPVATSHIRFQPVPKYPSVTRDLALVLDTDIMHKQIEDIIRSFSLVRELELFDVYAGKQIAADKKSLAYRVTFQSPTQTLTDEEVNKVQQQMLSKLTKELGATLRGQ